MANTISNGNYKFLDTITLPSDKIDVTIAFTANGITYTGIRFAIDTLYFTSDSTETEVYNTSSKWLTADANNQIIQVTTNTNVSDDVYSWFNDNAGILIRIYDNGTTRLATKNTIARRDIAVQVEVPLVEEIDTATEMNATMTAENEGKYYKFTGDSTSTFTKNGIYKVQYQTSTWAFWGYSGDISKITLISFTIAGTSYQAEEGMTWTEWCASSYNTDGYFINTSNYIVTKDEENRVGSATPTDIITSGTAYNLSSYGGGI